MFFKCKQWLFPISHAGGEGLIQFIIYLSACINCSNLHKVCSYGFSSSSDFKLIPKMSKFYKIIEISFAFINANCMWPHIGGDRQVEWTNFLIWNLFPLFLLLLLYSASPWYVHIFDTANVLNLITWVNINVNISKH